MTAPSEPRAVARLGQEPRAVTQTNESAAAVLSARARAEIEARTYLALTRPRDLGVFRSRMLDACTRIAFADSAMYSRPVGGGKTATGLSIRFAEEAARHYANLDVAVTVVSEDSESRTLEAVAIDLETNVIHRAQAVIPKYVERLSTREGDEVIGARRNSANRTTYRIRANDDALFTEHQKMSAKLKREAILFFIPSDIKEECEERIEQTMQSVAGDFERFLKQVVAAFAKANITEAQVAKYLGKSLTQATVAELAHLKRIYNAIAQGETTWDAVVARHGQTRGGSEAADELNAAVAAASGESA